MPYNVDAYCLRNFLEVVYQIRCNFFHGSKIPDSINIKLICWAYDCLDKLMKKLEDKNIIRF
ncbi:MAG: hypothetical protein IJZ30_03055 [Alphaproteobacteria bacterium]|nr:hypothetical protein [Alphaproteobacteria bacterium]